jgi:large repetitive protein
MNDANRTEHNGLAGNPRAFPFARVIVATLQACVLVALLAAVPGCGKANPPEEIQVRRPRLAGRRPEPQASEPATSSPATDAGSKDSSQPQLGLDQGYVYRNDRIRDVPWSINLLKVDRSRNDFEFTTTLGHGRTLGLSPLSEQIETLPSELGHPIVAINGDFYRTEQESYAGDPRGLQIARGELVSAPIGKTAFWVDTEGKPWMKNVSSQFRITWPGGETTPFGLNEERHSNDAILYTPRGGSSTHASGGRELILVRSGDGEWLPLRAGQTYTAEVREVRESGNSRLNSDIMVLSIGPMLLARVPRVKPGAVLQISTATSPDLRGVQVALGGGPVLLHEGKVQSTYEHKAYERHPRSAFGWNDQSFYLTEVDGRQYGFSVGMTLPEMAAYLARQGCQEAMNLDGGGSAEMWVEGQVVNRPCFGYERNTANGLVLLRKSKSLAQ